MLTPIFFKIVIIPTLDGLMFIFLINNFEFVDRAVKQADLIGLTIPDPELKWNPKTKNYDFGKIDWNEFWEVVNGNGFCNKERINNHVKAHEEGKWVRDAAIAYA